MGLYAEIRKVMRRNPDKDFRLEENFQSIQNVLAEKSVCLMPVILIDMFWPFEKEHGLPLAYSLPHSEEEIHEYNYAHALGIDVKSMRKCSSLSFSQKEMEDFLRLYGRKRASQANSFQDPDIYKKYVRRIGFGKSNAFWCYVTEHEGEEPLEALIENAKLFSYIGWPYDYNCKLPDAMKERAFRDKAYAKALKELITYAPLRCRDCEYYDPLTESYKVGNEAWKCFDIKTKLSSMNGNEDVYEDVFKACNGDINYMKTAFYGGFQSWFFGRKITEEEVRKYWPYRIFLAGKGDFKVPSHEWDRAIKVAREIFPAKMSDNLIEVLSQNEGRTSLNSHSYKVHLVFESHDAFVLHHGLSVFLSWQRIYKRFVAAFVFGEMPQHLDFSFNEEHEIKCLAFNGECRGWRKWYPVTHRDWYPDGCADEDPRAFNFKAFMEACKLAGVEPKSLTADLALPMMRLTSAMGTEFKRYVEKYYLENSDWKTAIHDAGQSFTASIRLSKEWRDAILKLGPEAAKASSMFNEFESVPRSLKELRNVIAHIQYGEEFPEELVRTCFELKLSKSQAEEYKAWLERTASKKAESCPDIDITIDGYRFRKLEADDLRGPLLGLYTNCCQHPNGAGSECAAHGWTSSYGAFYVVEHKGAIIGQSWAWRGGRKKLLNNPFFCDPYAKDSNLNTLCFDNIELLSDAYGPTVLKLYTEAARRMLGQLGIERVTVGLGYNDLQELETLRNDSYHAEPVDYDGYRDSHRQKILYTMLEY